MFFNNDLLFVGIASSFIVGGVILTYSFYNNIFPTVNKGESLVNTSATNSNLSSLDLSNNLLNNSTSKLIDIGTQTDTDILVETGIQTANTYVNTGMQTSARMWLESIKNWITEILGSGSSNPNPQYVDVGVQTNATSLWGTVKQWFLEVCSIRSSEISSLGYNKVDNWRNKLDSNQSVDLHNSNSDLTTFKFESDSELQNLVDPNDSASNVSEVVFEADRVYDITELKTVNLLMGDETIDFQIIVNIHYAVSDNMYLSIDPSIMILFL
jgi:hypothetical protein